MTPATPLKQPRKAVVVREQMEATQVLPPEAAAPKSAALTLKCDGASVRLDGRADTAAVARVLDAGWRRAQAGLAEIVRFGATLLAVAEWLENSYSPAENNSPKRGPGAYGLKGWLSEHCPEINYKTAYGYMMAAAGLRREARLADDVPLLALMGEDPVPEKKAEKLRARIYKVIADSTLSLLREAAYASEPAPKGGAREGAGRPQLEPSAETRAAAAWGLIGREIDRATDWHFERFLPEAMAREALGTVDLLRDALKARIAEFGKGAANVK